MKKVLLILCIILLTACDKPVEVYVDAEATQFKEEYEALNNKGIKMDIRTDVDVEYLKVDEVVNFLESKTGIIYFGFPGCPWCRNIVPVIFDVANENNQTVYYFNPSDVRGTNDENYNKIMNLLDEYLEKDSSGNKVLYVPDVYFVKNGNIVGHHLGSASTQTNPYNKLTNEQKQELTNTYNELIDKMED